MYIYKPWFGSWCFSPFSAAESVVAFHLDGRFVGPYHVFEIVGQIRASPVHPLLPVSFANELTVHAPTKSPSKRCSTSKNRSHMDGISTASEKAVKLIRCGFIIEAHLLFYNLFYFCRDLGWSA